MSLRPTCRNFPFSPPSLPLFSRFARKNISEQRILFEARRKGLGKKRERERIRKRGNKFFGAAKTTKSGWFPILFPPRNYSTYHEIIKVVDRSSIAQVARTGGPSFSPVLGQKIRRVLPKNRRRRRHFRPRRLTLNYSRTRRPDEDFIKIAATVIAVGFAQLKGRRREKTSFSSSSTKATKARSSRRRRTKRHARSRATLSKRVEEGERGVFQIYPWPLMIDAIFLHSPTAFFLT